ncbi:MAG: sulfatase [Acidobacteriota bacterium]
MSPSGRLVTEMRRRAGIGSPWLWLALICLVGCQPPGVGESPTDRLNVLLIVVDTLGAESVGAFAGERGPFEGDSPTPHLDRLAAESTVFRRAFSTAPWTQPAVSSLLTSQMPSSHGVVRLGNVLGEEHETLAEALARGGYRTGAVISHKLVGAEFGHDQGLDHLDETPVGGHGAITSPEVTVRALQWLDAEERQRETPFFLLAHYFDPHYVYHHHADFDRTSDYQGSLEPAQYIWDLRDNAAELDAADAAFLTGLYREEVAYTDQAVGDLLDGLAERGLDARTLVVVVSDHGEEILRRGWIGHTRTLYDELLWIPWILRLPGGVGAGSYDAPVSLLDVMPTILDLVGQPIPETAEGRSLAPWIERREDLPPRPVVAEVSFDDRVIAPDRVGQKTAFKTSVIDGDLKVIHDLLSDSWEMYDLASDPLETENLAGGGQPEEPRLRRFLLRWEQERDAGGGEAARTLRPSDDILDELRSLGYLR